MRRSFLLPLLLGLGAAGLGTVYSGQLSGDDGHRPRISRAAFFVGLGALEQPRPSRVDYARLDARLQHLVAQKDMVGLAIGVVENGEVRFLKGYGRTTVDGAEPVTTATVFRWASLSKGVAASMVGALAAEGRLSLDEPVSRYAPSLRLPGGAEHKITVAELLAHQIGIVSNAYDEKLEEGQDPHRLRGMLGTLTPICSPGMCHNYQNIAYDAASEIVERVTGLTYGEAVRQRLFAPLNMTSASTSRIGLMSAPSWAQPHAGGPKPIEVKDAYYRVPAAGGVNSSIKDLTLWMQAQMGEAPGTLPENVLDTIHAARVATPVEMRRLRKFRERIGEARYAMGWRDYDYAGHRVVGHRGGVRGYRSLILFDPVLRSGVVALWNSNSGKPGGVEFEVMDMIYSLPFKDWLEIDDPIQTAGGTGEGHG